MGEPSFDYAAEDSFTSFDGEEYDDFDYEDAFEPGTYLQYNELRLRLFFSDEEDGKLVDLITMEPGTFLFGERIIGMPLNDLLEMCKANGGSEIELEEGPHMLLFLYVEEWQITFTLEFDQVTQVSCGPFWKNKEEYIWPER